MWLPIFSIVYLSERLESWSISDTCGILSIHFTVELIYLDFIAVFA